MKIIGRQNEQSLLKKYFESPAPEFVAIYGRRRIGKTFLVNEFFHEEYAFQVTGLIKAKKSDQLRNFHAALRKYGNNPGEVQSEPPEDWFEAFERLIELLEYKAPKSGKDMRQVVFLDELPWFDTRKSGFITALEHFWNGWAASRPEILLIVCGSATSWMINKLIKNHGGLHNRVTQRIRLAPFTLKETEEYLFYRDIIWGRKEIAEAYMIFGGVPFYLSQLQQGMSLAQNVDMLCFSKDAFMQDEFSSLFASLFDDYERHVKILTALSSNSMGLSRDDILAATKLPSGGSTTRVIEELEQCGFITRYNNYSAKAGLFIYQLTDFFTAFYLKHMKNNKQLGFGFWSKSIGKGSYNNWIGYSFERLCLAHIDKVLQCLGVSGIITTPFAWKSDNAEAGSRAAQIDLLIKRADGIINICECKFTSEEYSIDKDEAEALRERVAAFSRENKARQACHITMITTYGVKQGKYSGLVQSEVTLDDLF